MQILAVLDQWIRCTPVYTVINFQMVKKKKKKKLTLGHIDQWHEY